MSHFNHNYNDVSLIVWGSHRAVSTNSEEKGESNPRLFVSFLAGLHIALHASPTDSNQSYFGITGSLSVFSPSPLKKKVTCDMNSLSDLIVTR